MQYGVDLLDLWRGKLSLRRIHSLLGQWTTTDYMLANVVDLGNVINWRLARDDKQPSPPPIPRPGDEKRQVATDARILSKVAKFREKNMARASAPAPDDTPRKEPA